MYCELNSKTTPTAWQTFTPTMRVETGSGFSPTYTKQFGYYITIGNLVFFTVELRGTYNNYSRTTSSRLLITLPTNLYGDTAHGVLNFVWGANSTGANPSGTGTTQSTATSVAIRGVSGWGVLTNGTWQVPIPSTAFAFSVTGVYAKP